MHHSSSRWRSVLAVLGLAVSACAALPPPLTPEAEKPAQVATVVASGSDFVAPVASVTLDQPEQPFVAADQSVFRLSEEDPYVGRPDALVTLVVFGDLQCPFTQRVMSTLKTLLNRYGERDLRVVWKHLPLDFHNEARPAAEASVAIHRIGGSQAFFCFVAEVFAHQQNLGPETYRAAASTCSVNPGAVEAEVRAGYPAQKVDLDIETSQAVGVHGTPTSYLNGIYVSGAQPVEAFTKVIDEERIAAEAMLADVPPGELHTRRVAINFSKRDDPLAAPKPVAAPDTTVYHVPIGRSPTLGSPNALVTIVMFQDFQCPFCKRSTTTIEELRRIYGNELRVVLKHNPLPFHPQAMDAAKLTLEARAQQGEAGFWKAYDALFHEAAIQEDTIDQVAQALRLNAQAVRSALTGNRHQAAIDADMQLAKQLGALGTPTFFINGRKLVGSQPIDVFRTLIDEVSASARVLTTRGVPRARIYDETIKNGATQPPAP
ncbi:MAG TPA: DsbA family protein [Polyangiaceae bacterium]|jgi:protein-disulfide isomerase|nr:MAG: Disulfide bond formation protein D precursor [Deltaproteobacteria bacterium ADurb.Bin207]HNS96662.1 DsbA family protein [Polyangiaceae bacterium]HNZ23054.1 DsbA family protein [Polyangiaceae bacterium]HOD21169.1 DsbA family protein [Polyangiaceae bacterium]HOE48937.1 DsbA family protein [Polyangiaceae bacterium]